MWLILVLVPLIIVGIVMSVAGLGIWGIAVIIVAGGALAGKLIGNAKRPGTTPPKTASGSAMASTGAAAGAGSGTPQDTEHKPQAEAETGYAHSGQEHMTPERGA
jgi:hypothetical protein